MSLEPEVVFVRAGRDLEPDEVVGRDIRSVVNCLNADLLKSLKAVLHGLQRFRGVSLPIRDLARDTQWLPGPVRLRRITPKPLIRQIGVILNRSSRFYHVDSAGTFAYRQLCSPRGCI